MATQSDERTRTSVAKVIEISCESSESFDDAIQRGIAKAADSVHGIRSAWIANQQVTVEKRRGRRIPRRSQGHIRARLSHEAAPTGSVGAANPSVSASSVRAGQRFHQLAAHPEGGFPDALDGLRRDAMGVAMSPSPVTALIAVSCRPRSVELRSPGHECAAPEATRNEASREPRDPRGPLDALIRDLRTREQGLSSREAKRRLVAYGANELVRRRDAAGRGSSPRSSRIRWRCCSGGRRAGLRRLERRVVGVAIVAVIVLNARLRVRPGAAGRARRRGAARLPAAAGDASLATTRRVQVVERASWCPATHARSSEGDRISADARLLEGAVEVDLSTLTGESLPVVRAAGRIADAAPLLERARPRLQRHDLHRRRGAGGRVRDRHADRARPHRRARPSGSRSRAEPARARRSGGSPG